MPIEFERSVKPQTPSGRFEPHEILGLSLYGHDGLLKKTDEELEKKRDELLKKWPVHEGPKEKDRPELDKYNKRMQDAIKTAFKSLETAEQRKAYYDNHAPRQYIVSDREKKLPVGDITVFTADKRGSVQQKQRLKNNEKIREEYKKINNIIHQSPSDPGWGSAKVTAITGEYDGKPCVAITIDSNNPAERDAVIESFAKQGIQLTRLKDPGLPEKLEKKAESSAEKEPDPSPPPAPGKK